MKIGYSGAKGVKNLNSQLKYSSRTVSQTVFDYPMCVLGRIPMSFVITHTHLNNFIPNTPKTVRITEVFTRRNNMN